MQHRDTADDHGTGGTNESSVQENETARNGTEKRMGAVTAIVVGSSASIDADPDAIDDPSTDDGEAGDSSDEERSDLDRLVLVSMGDYHPGVTVRVVDRLPAPITVQLLRLPNDETVPVLERPDEYTGYVVRSEPADDLVYSTSVVFARESLEVGTSYALESDSQVFSTRLNLLRATARHVE